MSAGREEDRAERGRANREASGWAILLQEEPDDQAVRAEFSAWLDANPVHGAAWAETQRISHVIRTAPIASPNRWDRRSPIILPFVGKGRRHGAGIAALAAAACLAIVAGPSLLLDLRADVSTGTGEIQSVHLADGSTMLVAPQSAVAFDVSKGGQREVRLIKGRAWFEVAPDPDHPFRVAAADTTTTVLGTGFEVSRIDDRLASVAVKHGHVRVSCDAQPRLTEGLTAGDTLSLRCDDASAVRSSIDPTQIAAWTDSQIVASDRPVMEVIDALKPWHSGVILTFGEGFAKRRVTGVYDAHHPARALQALAKAQDITVRNLTPWITVVSAE
ncbi:FecR domain-containing protein [Sphingobium sp. BHU LFT2]|uniref:FecR family protein n=1 Tax=Sphingobium sp. BHU LFT2 TaxID=2807634 RepID=UPI001BEC7A77|nr:FecR domain-containing protein [Sphingobium sp. BHU LFT2]MBT2245926.1 FecR domain-containing protein [Sphingobium sp. BHU LFT2]